MKKHEKILKYNELINNFNRNNISELDNSDITRNLYKVLNGNDFIKVTAKGILRKNTKERLYIGELQKKETYGFVLREDEDFFVNKIKNFNNGDIVLVRETRSRGKKKEGSIIDVVETFIEKIIFTKKKDKIYDYYNEFNDKDIEIEGFDINSLKTGSVFFAKFKYFKNNKMIFEFLNEIGSELDNDLDYKVVLEKHGINTTFSKDVLSEIDEENKIDLTDRVDLRDDITITIDGATSKDLDDAIGLIKTQDSYILKVSIADVTHYVKPGSKLDEEAQNRATSIYFVDQVVPMLPKVLSNGICSLHPNVDRNTLTCEMEIDFFGNLRNTKIYESVINSNYRLVYSDVNKLFDNDKDEINKYKDIYGILKEMNKLAKILNEKRVKKGSIELETADCKFIMDKDFEIDKIEKTTRGESEKLIEEFMVYTNEAVAQYMRGEEFVYRIHDKPNKKKLDNLKELFQTLEIVQSIDFDNLQPHDFKEILDNIDSDIIKAVVSKTIVRSFQKAIYTTQNVGHYGLALEEYTHFTSPIRRYPDMLVHRLVKMKNKGQDTKYDELEEILQFCSEKEVNAIKIEQEIEDRKKAKYMSKFIGKVQVGIISEIKDTAFFVELENTIRGMVKLKDIDKYTSNSRFEINFRDNTKLSVGDEVRVIVIGVNMNKGLIDFELEGYTKKVIDKNKKEKFKRRGNYKK